MNELDNLGLRSEKVRNIIGCVPPMLVREGIGLIGILLLVLAVVAFFVPYPENIETPIVVTNVNPEKETVYVDALVPYSQITHVRTGMQVSVELEGYEASEYGYIEGRVDGVKDTIVVQESGNRFIATVILTKPANHPVFPCQKGTAKILVSDKSIIQRICP